MRKEMCMGVRTSHSPIRNAISFPLTLTSNMLNSAWVMRQYNERSPGHGISIRTLSWRLERTWTAICKAFTRRSERVPITVWRTFVSSPFFGVYWFRRCSLCRRCLMGWEQDDHVRETVSIVDLGYINPAGAPSSADVLWDRRCL
jgi:hypothetical protein